MMSSKHIDRDRLGRPLPPPKDGADPWCTWCDEDLPETAWMLHEHDDGALAARILLGGARRSLGLCSRRGRGVLRPPRGRGSMTDAESSPQVERVEKEGVTLPSGVDLGQLRVEVISLATDSLPKLDLGTVRVESLSKRDDGCYDIKITGEPRKAGDSA